MVRWRAESARLPPVWPGFDSRTQRHMWGDFVVGSLLAPRGFLGILLLDASRSDKNPDKHSNSIDG